MSTSVADDTVRMTSAVRTAAFTSVSTAISARRAPSVIAGPAGTKRARSASSASRVRATRTRRPTDRARIWLHTAPIDPVAPITAAVMLAGSSPMRCAARSAPSTAVAAV